MQKVFTRSLVILFYFSLFYSRTLNHRILSPYCMKDCSPKLISRYPDFLYDIIYARRKLMNIFPSSIKINTHYFLYEAGMYSTISIIRGTEDIYNPPKTSIWYINSLILAYFFAWYIVFIQPIKNIIIVNALKNTSK